MRILESPEELYLRAENRLLRAQLSLYKRIEDEMRPLVPMTQVPEEGLPMQRPALESVTLPIAARATLFNEEFAWHCIGTWEWRGGDPLASNSPAIPTRRYEISYVISKPQMLHAPQRALVLQQLMENVSHRLAVALEKQELG